MTRIAVSREDGGVSIVELTDNATKEYIERDVRNVDGYMSHIEISDEDVFSLSREFRDAWTCKNGKINYDMDKAVAIQLERVRKIRDPLLSKYDGLELKEIAAEDSKKLAEIRTKKTELRDATEALKSLKLSSIEDIKAATPDLTGY